MVVNKRIALGFLALVTIISGFLLIALPIGVSRQIPAFLLLWFWPSIAWAICLAGRWSERILIGAGLSLLASGYLVFLISLLPAEISPQITLIAVVLFAFIPFIFSFRNHSDRLSIDNSLRTLLPIFLVLLLATLLRVINLDYKELQGDEGIIMARSAAIISGDESEIFLHQKGPMEIMLPTVSWVLTGAINDFWLRIPFAWAGIIAVLGIYTLAQRWFNNNAALASSLLFALGGFGIAFSRIVQYQSLVILWGLIALVCADRYRKSNRAIELIFSVLFISGAILAHYDALLVVPALLWIIFGKIRLEDGLKWKHYLLAGVVGLLFLLIFFFPYVTNPNFSRTLAYLVGDRVGLEDRSLAIGLGAVRGWQMSTLYNSTWYVLGLIILTSVGLIFLAKKRTQFAAVIYLFVPVIFYGFIVQDPRTHVYTIFAPAALMAGYGFLETWRNIQNRNNRFLTGNVILASIVWFVVVTLYSILLFVDTNPERQRTWELNRPVPWLYLTTWDSPPIFGLFGYPHQAGWRAALNLVDLENDLPYISNEEEEITNWYMSQMPRTHCPNFATYLKATNTQDTIPIPESWRENLNLSSVITVNGQPSLEIYSRNPSETVSFVEASDSDHWVTPKEIAPKLPSNLIPLDVNLEDKVRIVGYELDKSQAKPGDQIIVTIYWEALRPLERNYQVFTHLYSGVIEAQHDGAPECDINPTTLWEPGQIIPDSHVIELPNDISPGKIQLIIGMYDLITGVRLRDYQNGVDSIYLRDIDILEE